MTAKSDDPPRALPTLPLGVSERMIVFLVASVQFINILDFVMVMPLGPDFAVALHIPTSHLGFIGGAYTAAAAVSGIVGSLFLDRFDRRKALALAMLGLVLGTAGGGFATGLTSLLVARVVAGAFGGPATSLAQSIIADVVPPERRGKAMGAVMGAFSIASVVGVPLGLELARLGGWRTPFFALAGLGLVVTAGATFALPSLKLHLAARAAGFRQPRFREMFGQSRVLLSYSMTAVVTMSTFIIVPNISAFVLYNLGYPREGLGRLYLIGGIVSFVSMRLVGFLNDRFGSAPIGTIGALILGSVLYLGFYLSPPELPVLGIFVCFMLANSFRNVSYSTLTSKVPRPQERARFMSIQSSVQHFSAAAGAFVSARLLHELPDNRLVGMPRIVTISMALTALVPFLMWIVESRVVRRAEV